MSSEAWEGMPVEELLNLSRKVRKTCRIGRHPEDGIIWNYNYIIYMICIYIYTYNEVHQLMKYEFQHVLNSISSDHLIYLILFGLYRDWIISCFICRSDLWWSPIDGPQEVPSSACNTFRISQNKTKCISSPSYGRGDVKSTPYSLGPLEPLSQAQSWQACNACLKGNVILTFLRVK